MKTLRMMVVAMAAMSVWLATSVFTAGPTFRADYRFSGTALTDFKSVGSADWKVQNGEIVGTAKDTNGGWLLLGGKEFQDTQMYASVKCVGGCKAGFVMRVEKTPDGGMKGVLMSVTDNDLVPYIVKIDASGKEISREPLAAPAGRGGGGPTGGAPTGGGAAPATPDNLTARMAAATAALGGRAPNPGPPPPMSPELAAQYPKESRLAARPSGAFTPGDYNAVEVLLTDNSVQPKFNGGSLGGNSGRPIPDTERDGYGQIGFYVGGSGEVRIRDFMYKDILNHVWAPDETGRNFKQVRIDPHYYSWSTAVADFNHDNIPDVAAGAFYYLGPDYTVGKQIHTPVSFNPTSEWPIPAMVNLAYDFTGDGWPDVLQIGGNAGNGTGFVFVNPKGQSRHWAKYLTIAPVGNEETLFKDIDGDGRPDLIHAGMNRLRYSTFDPKKWDAANPTAMWTTHDVSEPGPWGVNIGHGLGVADINGDGRMDFLNAYGWWEQPAAATNETWKMHPTSFGRWGASQGGAGGAEICGFDVNGDGLDRRGRPDGGPRIRPRLVGAEARRQQEHLVRRARDHGQLHDQECRRRDVHRAACGDMRRYGRRWHPRPRDRQALHVALRLFGSGSVERAGAVRVPHRAQQAGARWCRVRARSRQQPVRRRVALRRGRHERRWDERHHHVGESRHVCLPESAQEARGE